MTSLLSRGIALLLMLCIWPLLLSVGLWIRIKYPGPIFFKQSREGKDGLAFEIWKLRTMVINSDVVLKQLLDNNPELAEEWATFACLKNDPRITGQIGKLLRQLSFDELPQLWNIFKGDMAFIGPRPLELYLAHTLEPEARALRNSVKPGLSGLWQIGLRSSTSIKQMHRYDKLYIKHKGIALDFYILCKTLIVVIKKTGV